MFYIYADDELIYRPLEPELSLLNPKLTLEMGKAGSLEFSIASTNKYYNRLSQLVTSVHVNFDDEAIFYGRVLSVKKAFNNVKTVYCEGDLSYLVDSVQKCMRYDGNTHDLFERIIAAHNARVEEKKQFVVGDVTIENRSVTLTGNSDGAEVAGDDYKQIAIDSIVDEWNNSLDFINTTLIDYCGGYLRTRHSNGIAYIDYVANYFGTASQTIELGKNLLDLNDELSVDDLFTVLIPLGDDNLTIATVNENGSDELVDQELVSKYGRIVKTHVFSNVNQPETLKANAERYMASHAETLRTIEISAVDLHMINPAIVAIHLGDRVHITSLPHELDEYLTCTKIEYDLTNAANNKYTFGNPKQTLTERYREDARKQTDTYGNSAESSVGRSGGGRASAAAAAAAADDAAKDAKDKADKDINKLYDTYIKVDESTGEITLQSIYNTLKNGCGIYLDPYDENYGSNVQIRAFNQAYKDKVAEITVALNEHGTSISLNADNISTNATKIEATNATITALAGDFQNLTTGKATASKLSAVAGSFGALFTSGPSGSLENVPTFTHYHTMSCDDNGVVSLGRATIEGPQTFNMAATNFFKTSMAAEFQRGREDITLSSYEHSEEAGRSGQTIRVSLAITLSNGNVYNGQQQKFTITDAAKDCWNTGWNAGHTQGVQDGIDRFESVQVPKLGTAYSGTLYEKHYGTYGAAYYTEFSGTLYWSGGTGSYYTYKG